MATYHRCALLHYDVVDGNVNEFDEKADESHDSKTNGSCQSNFLEFYKDKKTRITWVSTWNADMLNYLAAWISYTSSQIKGSMEFFCIDDEKKNEVTVI